MSQKSSRDSNEPRTSGKLFRHSKKCVRKVNGITIIFWSKDTIYVIGEQERFLITRWFETYGTYPEWRNMVLSLKRRNTLTMEETKKIARHYGFGMNAVLGQVPNIDGLEIVKEKNPWSKK